MKSINPKCTNEESFKYSIRISLHYYDLNSHKERTNQLKGLKQLQLQFKKLSQI